jgi:large subunit ribosomal protein L35
MAKSGKTRKSVAKRFKKTANGKIKYKRPGSRHLATSKSTKRKRNLRHDNVMFKGDQKRLEKSMALSR